MADWPSPARPRVLAWSKASLSVIGVEKVPRFEGVLAATPVAPFQAVELTPAGFTICELDVGANLVAKSVPCCIAVGSCATQIWQTNAVSKDRASLLIGRLP